MSRHYRQANRSQLRRRAPSLPAMICLSLLAAALFGFMLMLAAPKALAASDSSGGDGSSAGGSAPAQQLPVTDTNPDSAAAIRQNYFKRFPFARDAANQDSVQDQQSQGGGTGTTSSPAYGSVDHTCSQEEESPGATHSHYHTDQQQVATQNTTSRDNEATKTGQIKTYGMPLSDTQFQMIDRECKQRLLEQMNDPEKQVWQETTTNSMQANSMANSTAGAAETAFQGAFNSINSA